MPIHLSKNPNDRTHLIQALTTKLQLLHHPHEKELLLLRIKLIQDCNELSVQRIQHLEEIFKHYCTHIFKIGKHMTFQRLQYEKVHLTLDRLCVFIKDFGLNLATIDGLHKEVLQKKEIVRNFKRISTNCRDLSFEEFIACLEKLAVVYWDEKQMFKQKTSKFRSQRQARIAQYRRKQKQKVKQNNGDDDQKVTEAEKNQNQNNHQNEQQTEQKQQKQKQQQKKQQSQEQKNKEQDNQQQKFLEAPKNVKNSFEESMFELQNYVLQNSQKDSHTQKQNEPKYQKPEECILTSQQKIQYFYQLIGVDNAHDFRKKMSELGLPLFKVYNSSPKNNKKSSSSSKINSQLGKIFNQNQNEDTQRLIELRQKLSIKRQRDKHMYTPAMTNQQYQQRKRRRQELQNQLIEANLTQMNPRQIHKDKDIQNKDKAKDRDREQNKKKIQLMDKQISLDELNKISFDDLKHKFDPNKYVSQDESDSSFLREYGIDINHQQKQKTRKKSQTSSYSLSARQKTANSMQRKRTSSNIVEDFKKRAQEMQVKQFNKDIQLSKFANQMRKKQKNMRKQNVL